MSVLPSWTTGPVQILGVRPVSGDIKHKQRIGIALIAKYNKCARISPGDMVTSPPLSPPPSLTFPAISQAGWRALCFWSSRFFIFSFSIWSSFPSRCIYLALSPRGFWTGLTACEPPSLLQLHHQQRLTPFCKHSERFLWIGSTRDTCAWLLFYLLNIWCVMSKREVILMILPLSIKQRLYPCRFVGSGSLTETNVVNSDPQFQQIPVTTDPIMNDKVFTVGRNINIHNIRKIHPCSMIQIMWIYWLTIWRKKKLLQFYKSVVLAGGESSSFPDQLWQKLENFELRTVVDGRGLTTSFVSNLQLSVSSPLSITAVLDTHCKA